jgi:hypothetical protein
VSLWPPTELAEGPVIETFTEQYVVSDRARRGNRSMHLYFVQRGRPHGDGMLVAYLPQERLLIEADLLDTHEPLPAELVYALELDVERIVPIHGAPLAWEEFARLVGVPECGERPALQLCQ